MDILAVIAVLAAAVFLIALPTVAYRLWIRRSALDSPEKSSYQRSHEAEALTRINSIDGPFF